MKKFYTLALGMVFLMACKQTPSTGNFGEIISEEGAVEVNAFVAQMAQQEELVGKISGQVEEVCKSEGCWYTLALADGSSVFVKTKDHAFSLPKDCAGKIAIAEGRMYWKTTSVEDLKHYAEDAGDSPEEIAAITEPKRELRFEASGVIIK
jgi:hypothetical protein